jgi:hypothetical protein
MELNVAAIRTAEKAITECLLIRMGYVLVTEMASQLPPKINEM